MSVDPVYATRPRKLRKRYYINTYKNGQFYWEIRFDTKEDALEAMSDFDNWDKLCERIPPRKDIANA